MINIELKPMEMLPMKNKAQRGNYSESSERCILVCIDYRAKPCTCIQNHTAAAAAAGDDIQVFWICNLFSIFSTCECIFCQLEVLIKTLPFSNGAWVAIHFQLANGQKANTDIRTMHGAKQFYWNSILFYSLALFSLPFINRFLCKSKRKQK